MAGCADPPAHTLPAPQPVAEQLVAFVTAQACEDVSVEANPAAHEHAAGTAAAPAHAYPAPHTAHVAEDPLHDDVTPAGEEYPAKHAQDAGCAEPPAHLLPAVHGKHVAVDVVHAPDVIAVEA